MSELDLDFNQYLELEKLATGTFSPVFGFMGKTDFEGVVSNMHLSNGALFPLPVVLSVSGSTAQSLETGKVILLRFSGRVIGELYLEEMFTCDKLNVARHLFGTVDPAHPGVNDFLSGGDVFLGGPVELATKISRDHAHYDLTPQQTREAFAARGWDTITGFQTRNVPHRAHEYLHRLALELTDGLMVQPLVGKRRAGDYAPAAILAGYETLIRKFYPADRVLLTTLTTAMRYAGPREAVFHAIIRRNHGCTHFIVGRDHAGVGGYYGAYDAHALMRQVAHELGIIPLLLRGPFWCAACGSIVTDRTCPHKETMPSVTREISGTYIRSVLERDAVPDERMIRSEVVESLAGLEVFL